MSRQTNPLIVAEKNPKSLRKAITAFCAHCMGCTRGHHEPGWRKAVGQCTATQCPLWPHRPFQHHGEEEED